MCSLVIFALLLFSGFLKVWRFQENQHHTTKLWSLRDRSRFSAQCSGWIQQLCAGLWLPLKCKSAKRHNFWISNMASFMEICYLERRVGGRFWVMTYWACNLKNYAWRACPLRLWSCYPMCNFTLFGKYGRAVLGLVLEWYYRLDICTFNFVTAASRPMSWE